MAINTNEQSAVILQKINEEVPDGLAKETKLLQILTTDGKKQQKGGLYIQCPIKLIANSAQGFIAGTGASLPMDPYQQLVYMTFTWRYYNFNVNFSLDDYNKATGPEQVVDFMETKITGAVEDAARAWSAQINSTSVGNATYFDGLLDIVAASGTAYGGLTNTDYAAGSFMPLVWTDSIEPSKTTDAGTTGGFTTINYNNFNLMTTKLRLRIKGNGKGKKIMATCNDIVYGKLKTALQNQQIFINENDVVKAGFVGFEVDGVDVYPDADAPGSAVSGTTDNYLTMFPTDIMKMWYHFGFGTKSPFDGEVRVPNNVINSHQNFLSGNPLCLNRRLIAVAKNIG